MKKKYYLYEKDEKRWVEYDKESYEKMKKWRNTFCSNKRKKKSCFCPPEEQFKYCNTICVTCKYRKIEKYFSEPIPGSDNLTLEDRLMDETDLEAQIIEGGDLEKILLRLDELMPEARIIGKLRMQGFSDNEIAKEIGISRVTIYRKLSEAYEILNKEFDEVKKFKKKPKKMKQK